MVTGLAHGLGDHFQRRLVGGQVGAKPPSSPTAVLRPLPASAFFNWWKISAPARSSSAKWGRHGLDHEFLNIHIVVGVFAAVEIFIIGTGMLSALLPLRLAICWYRGYPAPGRRPGGRQRDGEMALAPKRALLSVPSAAIMTASSSRCAAASRPSSSSWIGPLTLPTAFSSSLALVATAIAIAQFQRLA